jgi:two-component system, chemotaxis family, CheB/CheR fusion protein
MKRGPKVASKRKRAGSRAMRTSRARSAKSASRARSAESASRAHSAEATRSAAAAELGSEPAAARSQDRPAPVKSDAKPTAKADGKHIAKSDGKAIAKSDGKALAKSDGKQLAAKFGGKTVASKTNGKPLAGKAGGKVIAATPTSNADAHNALAGGVPASEPVARPTSVPVERVPNPTLPTAGHTLQHAHSFPIVGIGASAGGLEALELFLGRVPRPSGAAFVVVQHLDPTHKGMLVELLRRVTSLDVVEAGDGMAVEVDHVYVIPPGKDMSLLHGTLHLLPQVTSRGRTLPIDFFFRSLAHDQGERSIGVILSGMGTDGTLGLRAIKEAAGATFVQSIESAKFDSMPRSVIDAGLADIVAPAENLPGKIFTYRDHAPFTHGEGDGRGREAQGAVDKICVLLREYSGNDFSLYKRSTIYRRIERRMGLQQITSFDEYLRYLRENNHALEVLFQELLIGVTSFFRDPGEWDRLHADVLPELVAARASSGLIRAWVAGCSTGEEAYSLAIALREALEPMRAQKSITVQIFATDLDRTAIEKARLGLYPENIAADVSPERLRRYFVREEHGYRVSKDIRESVVFAPQNVIMDPPFTKLDIVSCRNLMIYLSAEVQRKLIPMFHYCLNQGGVLFLGTAETVGSYGNLFMPLDGRTRLYSRLDPVVGALPPETHFTSFGRTLYPRSDREETQPLSGHTMQHLDKAVDRLLVQRFAPLGILCNTKGEVLYISGRAGEYFEPAIGKVNNNVIAMARAGLRFELSTAFTKSVREERTVTLHGVKVGSNGGTQYVDVTVQRLTEPRELAGSMLVVITEVSPPRPVKTKQTKGTGPVQPRIRDLEEELQRCREETQTVREEMQTSQEELKSMNEELQSTNEELQSTNEELTTSKEEMQSLNEELQTVNQELQSKVDELSRSNNDMKNLLNSTDIATLFLDGELRVRRFTTATSKIVRLIPVDIGRKITDIASELEYPGLAEDAREVLRSLIYKESSADTRDGRSYTVRIMPYRTIDNVIDGVVITFTDASAARALEKAANEQALQLRQMAESLPHLMWGARPDGAFDFVSRQWSEYTGVPEQEQLHWGWLDRVHPDDRDRVRQQWRTAIQTGAIFDSELRIRGHQGGYRWFKTRAMPVRNADGTVMKWYGASTDVDELKRAEARLDVLLHAMSDGFLGLDKDLQIVSVNPTLTKLVGSDEPLVGQTLFDVLPTARAAEPDILRAPADFELTIGNRAYPTRAERDVFGGFWLFVHTGRAAR